MRTLYVTPSFPARPTSGSEIRRSAILRGLLACGSVDALTYRKPDEIGSDAFVNCRRVFAFSSRHLLHGARTKRLYSSTLGRAYLTFCHRRPYEYLGQDWQRLRDEFRRTINLSDYDLVWFNTARVALPLGQVRGIPTLLDGDDIEYVREWMLLRSADWYGAKVLNYVNVAKLAALERSFCSRFTHVVRCSDADRKKFNAANVSVIPNGTTVPSVIQRSPGSRVLFVGLLSYSPNADGLRWFLNSVWPLVRQENPTATFDIIGRDPPQPVKEHHQRNGVIVHGFVDELSSWYGQAACAVVPLRAGGGTRLKILESLAHATPVISTTIGAFGIEAEEVQGLYLRDSAHDFAEQVVKVLRSPTAFQRFADCGRELMRRRYEWTAIENSVAKLAQSVSLQRTYGGFQSDSGRNVESLCNQGRFS